MITQTENASTTTGFFPSLFLNGGKNISIIIPCYNNFDITMQCIQFIIKNTPVPFEIIIINDGSEDETSNMCDIDTPEWNMKILHNSDNKGFAPSVNKGINETDKEFICIFNNDVFVPNGWICPLINALYKYPDYGMVSSKSISSDTMTVDVFTNLDEKNTFNSSADPVVILDWHKDIPWLFRKNVFEKIGLFDEQFVPGQYEDLDMQVRMAKNGIRLGVVPTSVVYHLISRTQAIANPKWGRYDVINRGRFIHKWGEPGNLDFERLFNGK